MSDTSLPDGLITLIKTATRALILACAAPGATGPQRVRQMTGYSEGEISKWQCETGAVIPLKVACQIECAIGKPILTGLLASLTGHQINPLGESPSATLDLVSEFVRATGSHARFTAQAAEALEDQKVTPGEAKALLASLLAHQDQNTILAARLAVVAGI